VIPRADQTPVPEQIVAHCRTRLAGFKAPALVVIVADLPRTSTGKVRKVELRDVARAEYSRVATPGQPTTVVGVGNE
jgi:acyl-CoA synthetase (AMP-forming)/AMP-acid ligase II